MTGIVQYTRMEPYPSYPRALIPGDRPVGAIDGHLLKSVSRSQVAAVTPRAAGGWPSRGRIAAMTCLRELGAHRKRRRLGNNRVRQHHQLNLVGGNILPRRRIASFIR